MAEPTHLNSGLLVLGLDEREGGVCAYGTTAIREEKSATQRGSFVSGIFNIARKGEREHKFLCKTARLAT